MTAPCPGASGTRRSRFLERDDFSLIRHPALAFYLSMIFSEDHCTPRIKSGASFFGIML
jgi:hypothetical protein